DVDYQLPDGEELLPNFGRSRSTPRQVDVSWRKNAYVQEDDSTADDEAISNKVVPKAVRGRGGRSRNATSRGSSGAKRGQTRKTDAIASTSVQGIIDDHSATEISS